MVIDKDLEVLITSSKMKSGNNYGTGMLLIHPITRKILLGERTDTHNMCSPGGKVEIGESPLQGVIRETKEESNVKLNSVKFYSYEMHTAENGKNWTSFMFLSDDFDDSELKPQESEVVSWDWYTVEEALGMDLFPPTRKSLERAIQEDLVYMAHQPDNYVSYLDMPTSASSASVAHDSCPCSYSYEEPEQIFTTHQLMPWD